MSVDCVATETPDVSEKIAHSILRMRAHSPFFGTLALFANRQITECTPTAATDGRNLLFNPRFIDSLREEEIDGVMLHEILHAAMLHPQRRGDRDKRLWNIAADIVVNGIVNAESWARLPRGAVVDQALENYTVEEVYVILEQNQNDDLTLGIVGEDLLESETGSDNSEDSPQTELDAYWRNAWNQAATLERMRVQGKIPAGLERLIGQINVPQLNWQTLLWRFLVRTPTDYSEVDRRQIHRGIYIEALAGENISAKIAVDTSGSIDGEALGQFISEIQEILRCYPSIKAELYYADADLYGPYPLEEEVRQPSVKGGGGTSFCPFFEAVEQCDSGEDTLCIYLTDGYGAFPAAPNYPVLWVVTPGGLADESFPFGEVARLGTARSAETN